VADEEIARDLTAKKLGFRRRANNKYCSFLWSVVQCSMTSSTIESELTAHEHFTDQ
jgi:hypothetical protein